MAVESRTPNFMLNQAYTVPGTNNKECTLEKGSFVRPIHSTYIPKHILDDSRYRWFNEEEDVFCYTRLGIVLIPRRYIYEV